MQPFLRNTLRRAHRVLFRGVIGRPFPERFQRFWLRMIAGATLGASGTTTQPGTWGVPGLWIRHGDSDDRRVMLYLHGGGYTLGSPQTHRTLASHLAKAARCSVLLPDYRLAPEHPYPAALDDAVLAYRALLDHFKPAQIILAGDSAGGGLALCTALALREAGLPRPSSLVLISPWTDLSLSGPTISSNADIDPLLTRGWLQRAADAYRGDLPAQDARVSPLNAVLDGLPPILIQVGSQEILLSDSQRLAERSRALGLDVRLQVEDGLWHDFQMHAGVLKAADAAIERIAAFVNQTSPLSTGTTA